MQTDSAVVLSSDEVQLQAWREKELVQAQASRDAALRMVERFRASQSEAVSPLRFDEVNRKLRERQTKYDALAVDRAALLAEQEDFVGSDGEEEGNEEGDAAVPPGGCQFCCSLAGDSEVVAVCAAGCV